MYIGQFDATGKLLAYEGKKNAQSVTIKTETAKTMFAIGNPNNKALTYDDYEVLFNDEMLAPKLIPAQ